MNYIVYDLSKDSPSLAERDMIWSVLLFGDEVNFISNLSPVIIIYERFNEFSFDEKVIAYAYFRKMIEPFISWEDFTVQLSDILQLRKRKIKTTLEQKILTNKEVWLRKHEAWFKTSLSDNLVKYHYKEIGALEEAGVHVTWADAEPGDNPLSLPIEHPVDIIANALSESHNVFLFDERIKPYIEGIHSQKIASMPLCYTLTANEVKIARNELRQHFNTFHECIYDVLNNRETLKGGMEKLKALLPELQEKINSNAYISKVRNQANLVTVDLNVAFTTKKNILTILGKRGMLTDQQVLQAWNTVHKTNDVNSMQAFMYITH